MDSPAATIDVVVWRSTTMDIGELCALMAGLEQILVWLVVSSGFRMLPVQLAIAQVLLWGE